MIAPKTIEDKIKVTPAISDKMEDAIERWFHMYVDAPRFDEDKNPLHSLNLPYAIASEKARLACIELVTEVYDESSEEQEEGTRAYFLNEQYKKLLDNLRNKITPGVALGTMIIKPIPDPSRGKIMFDFVMASEFFPITFTLDGQLTHAVFIEQISKKNITYTRMETHELKGGTITVKNEAFKSMTSDSSEIGSKIPLTDVGEWAELEPQITIQSSNGVELDRLLVACFIMPETNNVDVHSQLGMSAYAPAERLINQANSIFSSLLWEFEGGELAIDAPRNAIKDKKDDNGRIVSLVPKRQQRLFREVNVSQGANDIYNVYNPAFRDVSYINGLNTILMQIEDKVALARGTFSQVEAEARTATEIKTLKQRTFQSNRDLQERLQTVLEDVIYIMDVYATVYNMAPQGEYKTKFEWDDSILVDIDTELNQRLALVAQGGMYSEEVSAWYLGIDLETRFRDIQKYQELKVQYDPVEEPLEDLNIPR